jgi:hypothetical protein
MLFLLYKNVRLSSKLSEEEIRSRVENCITTISNTRSEQPEYKKIFIKYYSKPYEGKINGNTFKIKRRIKLFSKQKNPPIIIGEIIPLKYETQIQLKIRSSLFTIISLFSFLIIYFFFINIEIILVHYELIIPPVLSYLITLINFSIETSGSIEFLKHIFDAKESE